MIVAKHVEHGIYAERIPLSGAGHYQGKGHDVDIYAFGRDNAPLVAEVKARSSGEGFTTIERWLGEFDLLFLVRDQELPGKEAPPPLVVLPWETWMRLLRA